MRPAPSPRWVITFQGRDMQEPSICAVRTVRTEDYPEIHIGLFGACRGLVVAGGELGDPTVKVCRIEYFSDDD